MTQIQTFLIGLICLVGYFSLFESEDPRLGLYYQPLTHVSYIPAPYSCVCNQGSAVLTSHVSTPFGQSCMYTYVQPSLTCPLLGENQAICPRTNLICSIQYQVLGLMGPPVGRFEEVFEPFLSPWVLALPPAQLFSHYDISHTWFLFCFVLSNLPFLFQF